MYSTISKLISAVCKEDVRLRQGIPPTENNPSVLGTWANLCSISPIPLIREILEVVCFFTIRSWWLGWISTIMISRLMWLSFSQTFCSFHWQEGHVSHLFILNEWWDGRDVCTYIHIYTIRCLPWETSSLFGGGTLTPYSVYSRIQDG